MRIFRSKSACTGKRWIQVQVFLKKVCEAHTGHRQQKKEPKKVLFGAGDQTWTGTVVTPQDFKSCASADSATPANLSEFKKQ